MESPLTFHFLLYMINLLPLIILTFLPSDTKRLRIPDWETLNLSCPHIHCHGDGEPFGTCIPGHPPPHAMCKVSITSVQSWHPQPRGSSSGSQPRLSTCLLSVLKEHRRRDP